MELTLTTDDGFVVATWKIERDLDLPDLGELCDEFYAANKKNEEAGRLFSERELKAKVEAEIRAEKIQAAEEKRCDTINAANDKFAEVVAREAEAAKN